MPRRKLKTWFVVADGARALILKQDGANGRLERVDELEEALARRRARKLVSDKPGRALESVGFQRYGAAPARMMMRHALAPRTDPHRLEKERFIDGLARRIDAACANDEFDRLVVAAPAKALGDLRRALGEGARERLVKELPKDLTKVPAAELAGHLGASEPPRPKLR